MKSTTDGATVKSPRRATRVTTRKHQTLDEGQILALARKSAAKVLVKLLHCSDPWVRLESAREILGLRSDERR